MEATTTSKIDDWKDSEQKQKTTDFPPMTIPLVTPTPQAKEITTEKEVSNNFKEAKRIFNFLEMKIKFLEEKQR